MNADRLIRAQTAIDRIAAEARTVVDLCREVHGVVHGIVPADRWCAFAVDPATTFATNGYHDEGVPVAHVPRLLELEHGTSDHNQIRELARSSTGVATLAEATGGDPAASARYREVLAPAGLPHELRAVVRDAGRTWGALVLLRAADSPGFEPDDVDAIARCGPRLAAAFRAVLLRQHLDHADDAREAGILVVGGQPLEVASATPAAQEWLDLLDDGGHGGPLPTSVLSAMYASRAAPSGGPAAVRARTRGGRWVTITAERLADGGDSFGIVLQPSRPAEIAAIVGAAHRLTRRETEVVVLAAAGSSNREIASALGMSPHTVGDHLKHVFTKLGVATRGEMTSKLFHDHYLPREIAGRRVGLDGWFLD